MAFVPKLDFFLVTVAVVTCSTFLRSGSLLLDGRFGRIGALAKVAPFKEVGAPDFSRAPKYGSEVVELSLLELVVELLVLRILLDLLHDLLRQDTIVELTNESRVVHELVE